MINYANERLQQLFNQCAGAGSRAGQGGGGGLPGQGPPPVGCARSQAACVGGFV
jgi:hypothetical protein